MSAPYYRIPTKGRPYLTPWMISHELKHSAPRGAALKYNCRAGNKPGESGIKDDAKAIVALANSIQLESGDGAEIDAKTLAELRLAAEIVAEVIREAEHRAKLAAAISPQTKPKGKRKS